VNELLGGAAEPMDPHQTRPYILHGREELSYAQLRLSLMTGSSPVMRVDTIGR
jgi:hypothetical protein